MKATLVASCLYRTALLRLLRGDCWQDNTNLFWGRHHASCFTLLQPQNHKFIEVFLLSLHPNMHLSTYTHNKCVILLMAQKKTLRLMLLWHHFVSKQCDANKPECNLSSSDSHGWNDEQREESGELSLKRGASVKMSGSLWRRDAHQLFCLAVLGWKAF